MNVPMKLRQVGLLLALSSCCFIATYSYYSLKHGKTGIKGQREKVDELKRWIERHSGFVAPMNLAEFPGGRGVQADIDIPSNFSILVIPAKILLSAKVAQSSHVGSVLKEQSTEVVNAAFLCTERRNPNSFWRPYLDILPESFST